MAKRTEFYPAEIKALAESPKALLALAEWHEVQETMADASDFEESAAFHCTRKNELRTAAEWLNEVYENGDEPKFDS